MRAEPKLKSSGWMLCRFKSQGATVNGWNQVDSKFWSLAGLQRAVADNCKTDDDLILLECLQRVATEARVYRNVAERRFFVVMYERSRCANLVGRGSVAENEDWSKGRGTIINQKAEVQMSRA